MITVRFKASGALLCRVPDTEEGHRYAGYLARYKLGARPPVLPQLTIEGTDARGWITLGILSYPSGTGTSIPVGTERYIGDGVWARYTTVGWQPCPVPE